MNAYVFASQAAASACAPVVDAQQGYPRAGVNVGGGVHVTPLFVTQTYAQSIQSYSNPGQWAYPADAVTTPALAPQAAALGLPAPVTLDSTWYPPSAVQAQQGQQAPVSA